MKVLSYHITCRMLGSACSKLFATYVLSRGLTLSWSPSEKDDRIRTKDGYELTKKHEEHHIERHKARWKVVEKKLGEISRFKYTSNGMCSRQSKQLIHKAKVESLWDAQYELEAKHAGPEWTKWFSEHGGRDNNIW